MTRLSIVIPCFNRIDLLEETLIAVLQNQPRHTEVIVVHDGRYTDPYDLKDEVQWVTVAPGTSWVTSLQAGLAQATAPIVHALGAGVLPEVEWTEHAVELLDDPAVGSVCPVLLEPGASRRVCCVGVSVGPLMGRKLEGHRRELPESGGFRAKPLSPNLVAGFYRRDALEQVGGFSDQFGDTFADLDLGSRLAEAGYEVEVAWDSTLRVGPFDRPRRSFLSEGRAHQQWIAANQHAAAWRKSLSKWGQVAMDLVTSPLDPRRVLSAWGRCRAVSPAANTLRHDATDANVLAFADAKRQVDARDSEPVVRPRAA